MQHQFEKGGLLENCILDFSALRRTMHSVQVIYLLCSSQLVTNFLNGIIRMEYKECFENSNKNTTACPHLAHMMFAH